MYDMDSFDKPNEYDSNYESYPELKTLVMMKDALLCFAHETDKLQKIIACKTNMEYEFKRENIKQVKREIIQKIDSQSSLVEPGE